ncbi:SRPBCC family protein [Myroides guanonis]|uniref:Uncharacterized conserved protein YndB, AHSA1/START domain n=1 Tax=Myroides guanonis TaxID=1150112 RepID=A0A1I3KV43_9FLAO|nr:SRPBCC domain-containing protein [Myroides guanonis]SFI76389.1 Uncharacterized conserved protein YndB, AHSA1/START domain [Myroides guanonis]
MSSNRLFQFSINREEKAIHILREFEASLELVWQAWTTATLLDQWWAPLPYKNNTKLLDFRKGGVWHYAMIGPNNETHWAKFDYEDIQVNKSFSGSDAFCDQDGNVNTDFPRIHWNCIFSQKEDKTTVNITITSGSIETLDKLLEMGFRQGFTMGLDNLDKLLIQLKSRT